MAIPKKVQNRITQATKRFRDVLREAKTRDVNEADTVTIVKSMLSDVFGWDPFFEVTSEYRIRSSFVDLAVQDDQRMMYLVEVKAIGTDLRDNHLRQAVGYAANHGVDWVVLTNGEIWHVRKVGFTKPITMDLVCTLNFIDEDARTSGFLDRVFLLTKEGMTKSAIEDFHTERLAMSRFNLAAITTSDAVLKVVRRELRRAYPMLNPSVEQLREAFEAEVLKREVTQGDKAKEAAKTIGRATRSLRRAAKGRKQEPSTDAESVGPIGLEA